MTRLHLATVSHIALRHCDVLPVPTLRGGLYNPPR